MSEITIDEQIKLLEEQLAGLKKQKKIFGENAVLINLTKKLSKLKSVVLKYKQFM